MSRPRLQAALKRPPGQKRQSFVPILLFSSCPVVEMGVATLVCYLLCTALQELLSSQKICKQLFVVQQ